MDILNPLDFRYRPGIEAKPIPQGREKIEKLAKDYESVFLSQVLETMWEGISTDGLTGGGQSEGIWRSFMLQEYAKTMTAQGGIGLAKQITRDLIRAQEMQSRQTDPQAPAEPVPLPSAPGPVPVAGSIEVRA